MCRYKHKPPRVHCCRGCHPALNRHHTLRPLILLVATADMAYAKHRPANGTAYTRYTAQQAPTCKTSPPSATQWSKWGQAWIGCTWQALPSPDHCQPLSHCPPAQRTDTAQPTTFHMCLAASQQHVSAGIHNTPSNSTTNRAYNRPSAAGSAASSAL